MKPPRVIVDEDGEAWVALGAEAEHIMFRVADSDSWKMKGGDHMKFWQKAGSGGALIVAVLVTVLLLVLVQKLFDVSVWHVLSLGGLAVLWKAVEAWRDVRLAEVETEKELDKACTEIRVDLEREELRKQRLENDERERDLQTPPKD